ncbi:sensor histidine kinase [Motilimonas eburnea]|uniref:sensor histidine kinase n=1 Tax=Motilimonas eburnea TaxID=1737488 RepID=UPI001E369FB2|nr:HAMP domain-containing sensor histidine kinase [Motilimonas eburnea]MCE2569903.1 HAMP domain-containing histidine kinase [Motilimonas eburnea]
MTASTWAEQYCTQSSSLMMLYQPESHYLCQSKPLKAELTRGAVDIQRFLEKLDASELLQPDFTALSLQLDKVSHIDGLYLYELSHADHETTESWQMFANTMSRLHEIMLRLSQVDSLEQLYKQAIIEAQKHLYLDRLAIFLLDPETNEMVGTWGTDEDGQVKDETQFRGPIPEAPWVEMTLASKEHVEVWENVDLLYYNKVVGKGWNAMAAMWDGDKPIGWIACDNLVHKRPMQPWLKEIIGQFGQSLGHTLVRYNYLNELKHVNENLEALVIERSSQLKHKIELLEQTQSELVESEKLASLGGLVAGVSHEVNTPLGIGVTAASHLVVQAKQIQGLYQNKTMKKSDLETYFSYTLETGEIIENNLQRASELIKSFKQLAVDQSIDATFDINMKELVDNIQNSFHHKFKNRPISFINHIDEGVIFHACSSKLNQILTNLVNNSLVHGFDDGHQGTIEVNAAIESGQLHLSYFDTGTGVSDDILSKLFEPFFTTKRGKGGTGLGLNIVYNIIRKMDGKIELHHMQPSGLRADIYLPAED